MVSKLIMSMLMNRKPDLPLRRTQTKALIDLVRIRHSSEARVDELIAGAGLERVTPAQANALMVLFNAREPMTAAALAGELAVSEVTVGRFVRAMEESGWLERRPHPEDSRAYLLAPTVKARAALPRFIEITNRLLDEAFADFTREEIEAFAGLLARVRSNLDPRL